MKNIIIGILTLTSLISITFGLHQKNAKDKFESKLIEQERIITDLKKLAEEQKKIAEQNAMMARYNAMEAKRQEQKAKESLKNK